MATLVYAPGTRLPQGLIISRGKKYAFVECDHCGQQREVLSRSLTKITGACNPCGAQLREERRGRRQPSPKNGQAAKKAQPVQIERNDPPTKPNTPWALIIAPGDRLPSGIIVDSIDKKGMVRRVCSDCGETSTLHLSSVVLNKTSLCSRCCRKPENRRWRKREPLLFVPLNADVWENRVAKLTKELQRYRKEHLENARRLPVLQDAFDTLKQRYDGLERSLKRSQAEANSYRIQRDDERTVSKALSERWAQARARLTGLKMACLTLCIVSLFLLWLGYQLAS